MTRTFPSAVTTLVLGLGSGAAAAQDAQRLPVAEPIARVVACRDIAAAADRLACFDRHAAALSQALDGGEVVAVAREAAEESRRRGFGQPGAAAADPFAAAGEGLAPVRQITATLAAVRPLVAGRYLLSFGEAGRWQTLEADSRLFPKPGDAVTIERGSLGSFVASIGRARGVRVKRVD